LWLAAIRADLYLGPALRVILPADSDTDTILLDMQLRFARWRKGRVVGCSVHRFSKESCHAGASTGPYYRCKASKTPVLIAWLLDLCQALYRKIPEGDAELRRVCMTCIGFLWGLAKYFQMLRSCGRFFTLDESLTTFDAGMTFLFMYSDMTRMRYHSDNVFQQVPKYHQFHHLLLDLREDRMNPSYFHCFGDEDMVGLSIVLAKAGHANVVVDDTLDNYVIGVRHRTRGLKRKADEISNGP